LETGDNRIVTSPLANPNFRWLFSAQVFSLVGTGLLTVALSLAAFSIGGVKAAGQVLGVIFALKMVAYVGIAPLIEAVLSGVNRKIALVSLDFGRLLLLVLMAFTENTYQIVLLSFVFFVLSAGFTPLYQSVIPDVVPEKDAYARALSWSRIAYTLESILSPTIAVALLTFITGSFLQRVFKGMSIYIKTPRLKGLFLLNFALSLAMAWVFVNTVVYSGLRLGSSETYFPILMGFYGLGAALGASIVPRVVARLGERRTMSSGTFLFAAVGCFFSVLQNPTIWLLSVIWVGFGIASSLVLTPGGLVLTRSAQAKDRAAVFAAQFSLSHAGWLVAYPLAGWAATWVSLEAAAFVLSALCVVMTILALQVWPSHDPLEREHSHPELPSNHPHLRDPVANGANHRHFHAYTIDNLHPNWVDNPT
jgi:MFS family permease